MNPNNPLSVAVADSLSAYDIQNESFRLGNVSIEGDKYICVKENVNENTQVVVINLQNKISTRKYMKAESVIIHPNDPILALRGTIKNVNTIFLQVFNIETKEKICSLNLNEYMNYWKWINNDTIAIVCEKNVYHWNIDIHNSKKHKENYTLTKVFEKAQVFIDNNSQILYYGTDKDMKWCILCGISTQDQGKSIDGYMQLYSCDKKLHQTIEGFIGCFGSFIFDNWEMKPLFCFVEKKKNSSISRIHLMDIYTNKTETGTMPYKIVKEINLINEHISDFPIYMSLNTLQGVIYIVTKCSYVYIFDEGTLTQLVKEKISEDNIFICCDRKNGEGIYAVNKKGKIYYITINYVNLINHIKLSNFESKDKIIQNLCVKYGYPGCDYISSYKKCINEMDFKKASKLICLLKNTKMYEEYSSSIAEAVLIMTRKNVDIRIIPPLRTQQVLNSFKSMKNASGQLSPLLLYFSVLLEYDKLNTYESVELVKPVVLQKKKEYLEKWIKDDKLTCSEELGDLVKVLDLRLALNIYLRCGAHNKIISTYCLLNMFNNVLSYLNNFKNFSFDFVSIFIVIVNYESQYSNEKDGSSTMTDISGSSKNEAMDFFNDSSNSTNDSRQGKGSNNEVAVQYVKFLCENNIPFDINNIIDYLLSKKKLQEATSILLDFLKDNKPEHKNLQTKLFEFNLYNNVQVAETLFQMDIFTYYDKNRIAYLCEEKGLYQRALENYTNLNDIKRVITKSSCFQKNTNMNHNMEDSLPNRAISIDWIKKYFSTLSDSVCQDILFDFMKGNKINMEVVISICVQYYNKIGIKKIINKFEENKNYEGIFYFVSSILTHLPNLTSKSTDHLSYGNMNDDASSILLASDIGSQYSNAENSSNLKIEDVHFIMFKYIEACVKINNIQELDRICKDKNAMYNPEQIKNFLKDCKLSDPRPLIYVCDIHNYIEELAEYLYKNSLLKYIEVYVIKVNPNNAHKVIGVLLDLDASEDFLLNLLNNIKNISNIGNLIEIAEKRNRLKLLLPWLESRSNEGYENIELHNALAKIYIDLNKDPENFLKNNNFYDKKLIGKYCEDLDPHLAYTVYEKSNGECDEELIHITSKNGLFKLQAKYLVSRQSMELWIKVLDESNKYRKNVIDQVIGSTLIESNNAEEITVTVKAFIEKKLSSELIELLEKIVLHNSEFSDNKNLQNLLILTAIKSDSKKVMEYINRLDNFSAPQIASVAYQYKLREEAFVIYKKFNYYKLAISVLLDKILHVNHKSAYPCEFSGASSSVYNDSDDYVKQLGEGGSYGYQDRADNLFSGSNDVSGSLGESDSHDAQEFLLDAKLYEDDLNRAIEYAQKCNNNDVWFILGKAQLKINKIIDAIDSFVKSNNPEAYKEVITKCKENNFYEHLITYLNTLRDQNLLKDVLVDSELLYAYAKLKKTTEMTKFIGCTNSANLQLIGDRLFKEQEYEVAKILYSNIPNNQKLTFCYLKLKEYSLAIEAAKKAKSLKTWKEVNFICVKYKQLKHAHTAGLQLIMHADHLDEIIKIYEKKKYINELMSLLENGLNNERAHVGIYTELGILYAKYKPEKLMEYIRNYSNKMNTRKLIDVCQNEYLLKEAVYLYISYDEYNLAVDTIIKHSPTAYTPDTFMQVIHKVTNSDIIHKVIDFYIEEHPLNLYNLLKILENKIDNNRLVQTLKKSNNLPLIQKYLEDIQGQNITAVNETLNEIYLQNDDYISLRNSIDEYDNFNQTNLINKLENHKLPEMRRIAALLYKKNKKYKEAINLSKKEEQYKDAIEIARVSKNNSYVEDLINFFIEIKNKEALCACLIVCYDILKPDYILEIVWMSGYKDQAMLYFIQVISDYTNQIDVMKKQIEDMQKEKKMNKSAPNDFAANSMPGQFNYSLNNHLSIMPPQNTYMSSSSQYDKYDKYDMFNNNSHF
ncbi:clathrin heavy chain, putative [Plasmodium knowlesi strain H]|uniref:Clathrin heavy chain n=3 Tax=Plasmodium knowlesi TaxID=5850 RepID=A0A5K1V6T5_PLAKH|nr:clathrin heavy chain, putative [Plasmodium knowlesi strain H]OTN63599.1 Clathrin heavy chain [Plasmodium knowlesi]CAA9990983.1 clathrin heavy chain, putative [Plasmodium knowlesi strain H]SBO20762.1 clathrin heavy chain, putative [Plasmodium knowlesi strain H]SBO21216.1 clathrin heavy chain, putative [Plasmodium knowlesi strain H]VVS80457.1 clathrin heavy chain, putative [Plasmodium knowlesi strain H]|eukprot:XP_002262266.1 clathrin heavy chain, putative [Plasmodium knowlesi strain H]